MNYINHSGVLGMKWGRRKRSYNSSEHTEAKALAKKKLSSMSNKEMETYLKRANLEERMRKAKPDKLSSGAKKTASIMDGLGKVAAFAVTVTALAKVGQKAYEAIKKAKLDKLAKEVAKGDFNI